MRTAGEGCLNEAPELASLGDWRTIPGRFPDSRDQVERLRSQRIVHAACPGLPMHYLIASGVSPTRPVTTKSLASGHRILSPANISGPVPIIHEFLSNHRGREILTAIVDDKWPYHSLKGLGRTQGVQSPVHVFHCSEAAARLLAVDREAAAVEPAGNDSVR
jgi:hypothetical protein